MSRPRAWVAAAAAALSALAPLAGPGTATGRTPPRPDLRAGAAILVEARTGDVLLARRPDARRSIASATKLMTALLALETAEMGEVFLAPRYRALAVESMIGLRRGEAMTVRDLLHALLLESANDAAVALAQNLEGSRAAFVRAMNRRARQLGLRGTHYANPIGFDHPRNYSTARDLASLTRRLMASRRFARIVDRPRAVLRSGARRRVVDNRNDLVARYPFVNGVKTGHTARASFVLVGAARGNGAQLISVVLGEPSEAARNADTLALLRYGIAQFRRVRALSPRRTLVRVPVEHGGGARAALGVRRAVTVAVRRGERPGISVRAPEEIEGPLPAGRRVGTVELRSRGRLLGTVPLVTRQAVPAPDILRRLGSALGLALLVAVLGAILVAVAFVVLRAREARPARVPATTDER